MVPVRQPTRAKPDCDLVGGPGLEYALMDARPAPQATSASRRTKTQRSSGMLSASLSAKNCEAQCLR